MIDIYVGDCRRMLQTLPAGSVQSCITSPAYFGKRDYGVSGQLGLEKTPEEYVANLVAVFADVRRVLRDDGTCWLNLGDSFNAHPGQRKVSDKAGTKQRTVRGSTNTPSRSIDDLKPKDLVMIPFRVALALQADGWWVRQTIIWSKPNGMPESVEDRPTTSHEYIFLLSKSERYFYDGEAIKEPMVEYERRRRLKEAERGVDTVFQLASDGQTGQNPPDKTGVIRNAKRRQELAQTGLRNRRSVWTIATSPYKGAHFATFPPDLVEPMIKAGTSERGCCPACGAAWVRVVEKPDFSQQPKRNSNHREGEMLSHGAGFMTSAGQAWQDWRDANPDVTIGWRPSCNCPAHEPVPCTVLDPFFGAGTVGLVADRLGRNCIGIELNPKYVKLAERRIKEESPMFVQIQVRGG